MPARNLFDRTVAELALAVGPRQRTALYRIERALVAAGAADSQDAAAALLWDAVDALGNGTTVYEALEHAGVDVDAVRRHLALIDEDHLQREDEELREQLRRGA